MSFVANLQRNPGAFLFSGGSRGARQPPRPLPLYLDQTEDRRSQKKFCRLPPPPPPRPRPLISRSGCGIVSFAAVIRVVTRHATLLPTCVTSDDPNNGCEGD